MSYRAASWRIATIIASVFLLTSGWSAAQSPLRGYLSAHDPSTIIQCKNRYYIFSTGQGILSKSSADKIFWKPGPSIFSTPPSWTTNAVPGFAGIFWAPDILYFNNQFHLYYAVSTFGSQVSAIGLATNPTLDPSDPAYHWTDQGPVIASTNGSPYNTIDPSFTWDNAGNLWMAFGSYWNGIYLVQLDSSSGLRISQNSPTYHLASNSSIEASYVWRRGGYYYLFVNWGSCCSGVNSTYNIRVGRSTAITGPYLDKNGVDMASGGGTLFMQSSGKYTGPGHVGILSENGNLSLTHHYYDANAFDSGYDAYGAAKFALLPLSWTADDWPSVTNDWSALYNFQADARDENNQYYGLLQNGATTIPDATFGHVLNLNGINQYAWLPPGVAYGKTFVAVVNWRGGAPWQRIFDFGFDTSRTVMMTPSSDANVLRCDLNPGGNLQTIQWTKPLPSNVWTHVALTLDGSRGVLYVNGLPVATNASMNILPLQVAPQTNHLGRSKFAADAYFNGEFASFRSYGRVLSAAEIVAPIPVISQPADGASYSPGGIIKFNGSATDFASRPLNSSNLTWQINHIIDGRTNTVFGPVTGVTNGTFAIPTNATDGGSYSVVLKAKDSFNRQSSAVTTLSPANPPADWSSYYPFKSNAADANGHYDGTPLGGASFVTDPTRGNVLNLSGTNQYVSFPSGLAGMKTFTAWVKWNGGAAWQRIFDFGNDINRYTVLTPLAANGKLRFNISINSISGEQVADAPAGFPVGVWTHVAVVMNATSAILYIDGAPVATNLYANLLPSDLNATNIYFGKSQWPADPYFNGRLSSVRIFSRALTSNEIVAPQITLSQPSQGSVYRAGDTISFAGSANDFYDAPIDASALTWTVNFINAGLTNTVLGPLSGVATGSFNIPATGTAATNGFYQIQLSAVDSAGRAATNSARIFPTSTDPGWASFYPFTSGAQDASNNFGGTLRNGASIVSDPVRGNVLNLASSSSQYVSLPPGAGGAETISGWVKWNGGASWQRIFDFGNNTSQFFFLTPSDSASRPQCAITAAGSTYVQTIESPVTLPVGQWTHLAVVMDGRQGMLYLNGNAVAVNNSVNLLPSDIGPTNCWFGRSEFATDAYFNGRMSAVHLNSSALPISQIFAPQPVITQPTQGSLFAGGQPLNFAGAATDYSDAPLAFNAFSWTGEFHSNGVTYAAFGPLAGITNGSFIVPTNAATITNIFYRITLAVTDTNGRQQTISRDVIPQTSQLSLETIPTGLQLSLDGQTLSTPTTFAAVAGMSRQLSAPASQNISGTNVQFVIWSDGGAITHNVLVPSSNTIFAASYMQPSLGAIFGTDTVNLSWPQWASAMKLYSATNLTPPIFWSPVTAEPFISNGVFNVQLPPSVNLFYRLQTP